MNNEKRGSQHNQQDKKTSPDRADESSREAKDHDKNATAPAASQAQRRKQDRLETIEQADDRTSESPNERARDVGAETAGDPGQLLSQPSGDGNYVKERGNDNPVLGGADTAMDSD